MEREMAMKIMDCLLRFSPPFNDLTELSDQLGSREDGVAMRRKLAPILPCIYDIMSPIIREYPDLDPDKGK